ncbi:MAG: endo-1,4-beta-xylanase [Ruminococcus sp.]|jgi:endo-1,4-beta-xylanase|nr:endo-1,4-beta-xylanase [Ruminococcus sp.]
MNKKFISILLSISMLLSLIAFMPVSAEDEVLLNSTFEDDTENWGVWTGAVALTDGGHESDQCLTFSNRSEDWHAPVYNATKILLAGGTYQFSAWVRFASGEDTAALSLKYADADGAAVYATLAEGIASEEWSEITGEYTIPDDATNCEIYFQSANLADIFIDDVQVIGDSAYKLPEPPGDPITVDFENGLDGFAPRAGGTDTVELSDKYAHSGTYSLYDSGRTESWNAPIKFVSTLFPEGKTYTYSVWVYSEYTTMDFELSATYSLNGEVLYPAIAKQNVPAGQWTEVKGSFTIPIDSLSCGVYIGPAYSANDSTATYYIDDFSVYEAVYEIQDLAPLKDVFGEYFKIGNAMMDSEVASPYSQELFNKHFNSITFGNELKPENVLNRAASQKLSKAGDDLNPQVSFKAADQLLKFAIENDIPVRGHTLVWHSQTPDWFFKEGYADDGAWLTKEDMAVRMENYIKNVFSGLAEQYPEANFYAYDVVNEAYNDSGEPRPESQPSYTSSNIGDSSPWVRIWGNNDFMELAFTYAAKYRDEFMPGCSLFYNDYNEYTQGKITAISAMAKDFYAKGILDGIGMQSHLDLAYPSVTDSWGYESALKAYSEIGCEIQITELDITLAQNANAETENNKDALIEKQAESYKNVFDLLVKYKEQGANITAVVIWGMLDSMSWRSDRYPLLFDGEFQAKPAYYSIVEGREWTPTEPKTYEPGDSDKSGEVNLADFVAIKKFTLGINVKIDSSLSDINSDGLINSVDLAIIKNIILTN